MTTAIARPQTDWLARLRSIAVLRPGQRMVHLPGIGVTTSRRAVSAGGFAGTNFFSASYTGSSRNDFTGQVGFLMTTYYNAFTIVALGRMVRTAIAASHTIRLWMPSTTLLQTSAVITSASPIDGLGYAYEVLETPFTVEPSTTYFLTSTEVIGGDPWNELTSISSHSVLAHIFHGVYNNSLTDYAGFGYSGGDEQGYVPPTFYT